jgi:hypothetical protein
MKGLLYFSIAALCFGCAYGQLGHKWNATIRVVDEMGQPVTNAGPNHS